MTTSNLFIPELNVVKLHRMHEIRPTVTDVPGNCYSISLSRIFVRLHSANMAEQIEIRLRAETLGDQRSSVSDGRPVFPYGFHVAFAK